MAGLRFCPQPAQFALDENEPAPRCFPAGTPLLMRKAPRLVSLTWPLMAELVLGFGVGLLGLWLAARQSDTSAAAFVGKLAQGASRS